MASEPQALASLLALLVLGTSTNPNDLRTSEAQLSSYEAQYHSHSSPEVRPWTAYARIALPGSAEPIPLPPAHQNSEIAVRTLAIIRLKHAIDKYWRGARMVAKSRTGTSAVTIQDEDKAALRDILLSHSLYEKNRGVALQASVCISKIARLDYPASWPDLFEKSFQALHHAASQVIAALSSSDAKPAADARLEENALIALRAAEIAKRSIKELSQVKLVSGKIRMTELAKTTLPSLLSFYPQLFSATFPSSVSSEAVFGWLTSKPPAILVSLVRVSHLLFKMMSALAIADVGTLSARVSRTDGESSSNTSLDLFQSTPSFLVHIFDTRLAFLEVQASSSLDQGLRRQTQAMGHNLTKHLSAFGKLYLGLLDKDKSRVTSWPGWSEIVAWYWTKTGQAPASAKEKSRDIDEEALMPFPSTLVVHTLLLLRRSLEAWHSPSNRGRPIPSPFDTDDFAVSTAEIVVDYFLPFERSALERWEVDPEQWTVEEEQAQEDFTREIRPCAERLLMVLASHSKAKRVGRAIWNRFLQSSSYDVHDMSQIVRRDAVYTALGRLRDYLPATESEGYDEESEKIQNDRIDVSKAFVERLLPEAAQVPPLVSPAWVLIRRRVSWLLYEYSEKISPSARDSVYRLLTMLLDAKSELGGDIAVRLSAARTLGALIDDIGFDAEVFQPYLESAIKSLAELATSDELALMDSIAMSTRSLSILIERSGPRVAPLIQTLSELAPVLWSKEGNDECKTRPAVLTFVKSMLRATESIASSEPALSSTLQRLVAPLVTACLQPALAPLLAQDALQLWHKAVRCAANMQSEVFDLLRVALDIDGSNGGQGPLTEIPDYASEVGRVIEEYALWFEAVGGAGPGGIAREMLRVYGIPLFASWARVLSEDPMNLYPIQAIDLIAQSMCAGDRLEATGSLSSLETSARLHACPSSYNGANVFAEALTQSGLFEAIVRGTVVLKESTIPGGQYVALLSRLSVCFPAGAFVAILRSTLEAIQRSPDGPSGGQSGRQSDCAIDAALVHNLPAVLLSQFPSKFETTASARRRKLIAMGMCAIVSGANGTGDLDRQVFSKISEWVGTWLDALSEIRQKTGDGADGAPPSILTAPSPTLGPSRGYDDEIGGDAYLEDDSGWLEDVSAGSARSRHLADVDLALRVPLAEAVKDALAAASSNTAPGIMDEVWASMDPMVLDLLKRELGMA
ncbi:unnamed protein product [Parajaminaea phylloscopi]